MALQVGSKVELRTVDNDIQVIPAEDIVKGEVFRLQHNEPWHEALLDASTAKEGILIPCIELENGKRKH